MSTGGTAPSQPNPKRQRSSCNPSGGGDDDDDDDDDVSERKAGDDDDGGDDSSGSESESEDEEEGRPPRIIQSLGNYFHVPAPLITETLRSDFSANDGIYAEGYPQLVALPSMIPHQGAPSHNPCPLVAGSLFRHLVPVTTAAQFDALPVGARLHVFWQSPGWPDAFYSATKIS